MCNYRGERFHVDSSFPIFLLHLNYIEQVFEMVTCTSVATGEGMLGPVPHNFDMLKLRLWALHGKNLLQKALGPLVHGERQRL